MDILIKSFNRPYYLDRCIQSVYMHCMGEDLEIKVLDDGTPQKYLDKIQQKFPSIKFYKSEFYTQKVAFTERGERPKTHNIPIDLWIKIASESSQNFILLEDDIWFTESINITELQRTIDQENLSFVKLFWLGNPILVQEKSSIIKNKIRIFKADLFVENPILYNFIFYKFNRFKIRKTLQNLKIHTRKRHLSYYSIYSVAGVVFNKDYFAALWNSHKNEVDEFLQLYNAVNYKFINKTAAFARTENEIVRTGFSSSATNQFKNYEDVNVDMFRFNKIINDAWLEGDFDAMANFPADFPQDNIIEILKASKDSEIRTEEWQKWVAKFKNQFTAFGCQID